MNRDIPPVQGRVGYQINSYICTAEPGIAVEKCSIVHSIIHSTVCLFSARDLRPQNTKCTYKCIALGLWVWLAEAVQQECHRWPIHVRCCTPCDLQEMYTKVVWTDESLLVSPLTYAGPHCCMQPLVGQHNQ